MLTQGAPRRTLSGGAKNLNTFVSNSIWFTLPCRRFAATHVVHLKTLLHFFNFFCLLSLVFLAPIYANLLWNCFRRAKSCWGVGMLGVPAPSGGKLSCSRTLRSAAWLIVQSKRVRQGEEREQTDAKVHFAAKSRHSWATFLSCFFYTLARVIFTFVWSLLGYQEDIWKSIKFIDAESASTGRLN